MYIYTSHIFIYICMFIYDYDHLFIHLFIMYIYTYLYIYIYTHTCIHRCVCVCARVFVNFHMFCLRSFEATEHCICCAFAGQCAGPELVSEYHFFKTQDKTIVVPPRALQRILMATSKKNRCNMNFSF